jgi:protein-disulfide isomerase
VGVVALPTKSHGQGSAKATSAPAKTKTASTKTAATAPSSKEPVKTMGSRNAPITMEVYSDFQCPGCRDLFLGTIKPMMDDYVHTGKVFFVHRDNPLPGHPYARDAARFACAAGQIGKFEKVAEAIYVAQSAWTVDRSKLDLAVASALTPGEFAQVRASFKSLAVETSIDQDLGRGRTVPVTSTPTVVLTHKGQRIPLPGGVNYPLLRRVLDQLLSQR